jgi:hypothetical protein
MTVIVPQEALVTEAGGSCNPEDAWSTLPINFLGFLTFSFLQPHPDYHQKKGEGICSSVMSLSKRDALLYSGEKGTQTLTQ